MSAVLDPIETLDDEQQRTPTWEEYRKQRGNGDERKTCPKGTYEALLIETTLVRRKDGGGYVLRLIARTIGLGVYLVSWRGLSASDMDPYNLTEAEVRSLRKFADRMGIPTPAPARQIVAALHELNGAQVEAKVSHGPTGLQTTLSRHGAAPPASTSPGELAEGEVTEAQAAHMTLLHGLGQVRLGLTHVAEGCHRLARSEGWRALGYESLSEYLAAPEITLSRSQFYRLADIYETYVVSGGVDQALLVGAEESKLEVPLPAVKQGLVSAEVAVADAGSLSRRDLRDRYRELLGGDEPDTAPPTINVQAQDVEPDSPAGGTDSGWQDDVRDPDGNVVDLADIAGWVERNGHPEEWVKKAQAAHGKYDEALVEISARDRQVAELRDQLREQDDQRGDRIVELETELEALKDQLEQRPHQTDLSHMSVAQGLTLVLARVLREIGAPEQKRMGKDLRAAVVAALDEAREHGLDVEG